MSVKWMLSVRQHQLQTLHDELVFFGRFHRNPINKALHVVGVAPPPPPPLYTHTHTGYVRLQTGKEADGHGLRYTQRRRRVGGIWMTGFWGGGSQTAMRVKSVSENLK